MIQSQVIAHESPRKTRDELSARFTAIREFTELLCESLEVEDYCIQSMPDASPARWHLAHTTWFFETFILEPFGRQGPAPSDFRYLFNSYYNAVGDQFPRAQRGLLSRPTVREIYSYRREVTAAVLELLGSEPSNLSDEFTQLLELGLQHEQQHQELILTDIKHALYQNPSRPALRTATLSDTVSATELEWLSFPGGVQSIGSANETAMFSFDNERPTHQVFLQPYQLANRLVTNGEYLDFIEDGGYQKSHFWLSEGWSWVGTNSILCPLYWEQVDGEWQEYTLAGMQSLHGDRPVCHLNYFEADAYARWAGKRLPTESEWESAALATARFEEKCENFAELSVSRGLPIHPQVEHHKCGLLGNVWQWTSSAYSPYPGFAPQSGAVGEYNGKFMCNQYVLRGGSVATSSTHIRPTYRNFFPTSARWQFSGIRLAAQVD